MLLLLLSAVPVAAAGLRFELDIHFNAPVQDGSFTLADVAVADGGGPITPVSLVKVDSQRYTLSLAGLTGLESCTFSIGTDILDAQGDPPAAGFTARLIANNITVTSGDASLDGLHLVFARSSAAVQGSHAFAGVQAQREATPLFDQATTLAFQSVRVEGTGASLRIGGGAVWRGYLGVARPGRLLHFPSPPINRPTAASAETRRKRPTAFTRSRPSCAMPAGRSSARRAKTSW